MKMQCHIIFSPSCAIIAWFQRANVNFVKLMFSLNVNSTMRYSLELYFSSYKMQFYSLKRSTLLMFRAMRKFLGPLLCLRAPNQFSRFGTTDNLELASLALQLELQVAEIWKLNLSKFHQCFPYIFDEQILS